MKNKRLIGVIFAAIIGFTSCDKPNPLNEDSMRSVAIHTTMVTDYTKYPGAPMDTLYYRYNGTGMLYRPFDTSLIDTMVQIADSPWYRNTFRLSNGHTIEPIKIYTYNEGFVLIDNLEEDDYMLLRFSKGTLKGDIYDWLYLDITKRNTDIYDTLWHWGVYHIRY